MPGMPGTAEANEPTFTASRFGFQFTVYANRIEVAERGLLGNTKREMIPLRNVASVEKASIAGRLRVTTTDGKRHEWVIGPEVEAARSAIASLL